MISLETIISEYIGFCQYQKRLSNLHIIFCRPLLCLCQLFIAYIRGGHLITKQGKPDCLGSDSTGTIKNVCMMVISYD